MDMNELRGRVLKVSLARPLKGVQQPAGNRASKLYVVLNRGIMLSGPFFSLGVRGMAQTKRETIVWQWR